MSRVQATQGASSIEGRINKGRLVINSVRACCGLGGRGVLGMWQRSTHEADY